MPINRIPRPRRTEERVEYISRETADQCLVDYCEEFDINLNRIPHENIGSFLNEIRYTPLDVPTEAVAEICGITPEDYISETPIVESLNDFENDFEQWYSTVINNSRPARISNNFAELRQEANASQNTAIPISFADIAVSTPIFQTTMAKKKKKPQRSEREIMMEIIRGENFPKPNFKDWSSRKELQDIVNDWFRNIEYREQWIFSRREREGFNRRNVGMFNLDDVMARMTKRKNGHPLDTEKSKFYDWKLGGTDWTLRLELYQHEQYYFLISRYIHKPTHAEIKYDVRYWSGNSFQVINTLVSNEKGHELQFEMAFGSNNPDSDYYVEPHDGNDDDFYDSPFYYTRESDDDCLEEPWEDD
jgi:hypothetical protein